MKLETVGTAFAVWFGVATCAAIGAAASAMLGYGPGLGAACALVTLLLAAVGVHEITRPRDSDNQSGDWMYSWACVRPTSPTPPPPPPAFKVLPEVSANIDALLSDPAFERELVAVILANRNRLGK